MTNLYDNPNFIFSISVKILLLFVFLTCFFYIIIQKQVSNGLSDNITNTITNNFDLNFFSNYYRITRLSDSNYHTKDSIMYNNIIYVLNISIIIFLLCISIIIYYTSTVFCKRKISLKQIIIFNVLLYIIVGIIEYAFFINIASKYIPITNGEILENIKLYFNK
jgi:hypothetical protein